MATKNTPEWKTKTLAEFEAGSKVWRAQKLKSPDGDILYGIKAFAKKKDGTLVITRQGFTILKDQCDKDLLVGISNLLKAINKELK